MTDAEQIKSTVQVCMFDQYGTVVDMQTGLVEAATPFLRAKGWQRGAGWHEGEANYATLLQWNAAPVYARTIGLFADRLEGGGEGTERAPFRDGGGDGG